MTESPTAVFYGSAKAEAAPPLKQESKIVRGIKNVVGTWLDRIGPKNVEKHFIEAHERVLATLDSDQRKEVFTREAEKWQKAGKRWGVAATVIDSALIAVGAGFAFVGIRNPNICASLYENVVTKTFHEGVPQDNVGYWFYKQIIDTASRLGGFPKNNEFRLDEDIRTQAGRFFGGMSVIPSLGILIGSGPGHWLAHLTAGGKEQFGKMKARTNNYVDSGKAAEHAAKVGNAIGKAATETAKYVAEHPDEIRKTVETANRVSRQNAESKQKIAEAKQKTADSALEAEYQNWLAHHPDKIYYEQSGEPMPSKTDYIAMKKQQEEAHKANLEAERRGQAKH